MNALSASPLAAPRPSHYSPSVAPEDAVARCTAQLQRHTGTSVTRLLRAKAYVQLGDYAAASADLDRWMQDPDATKASGGALKLGEDADEAATVMADALFYRGVCRARLAQVEAAMDDFAEVLRREPQRTRAMYELAACEARLGDFSSAVAHYEAALQLDEVGKEKAKLLRHRTRRARQQAQFKRQQQRRLKVRQQEEEEQREAERHAQQLPPALQLDTTPLSHPAATTPLTKVLTSAADSIKDVPLDAVHASSRSSRNTRASPSPSDDRIEEAFVDAYPVLPVSSRAVSNTDIQSRHHHHHHRAHSYHSTNSGLRRSFDAASDSVVAAVSLSEFTGSVGGAGGADRVRAMHSNASSEHPSRRTSLGRRSDMEAEVDEFTGVSSSTASSADLESVERDGDAAATATTSAYPTQGLLRRGNPENAYDELSAMDPTNILSSCSDLDAFEEEEAAIERQRSAKVTGEGHGGVAAAAADGTAPSTPLLSAAYYYQKGLQHRRRGELAEAIEMYTKALELDRTHFKALFNRAFCYDKLKEYDCAIADYNDAIELDPDNAFTFYNLGISYDHKANHSSAVNAFTRAIELDNRKPDFYHNRGFSQRKQGKYEAAIADYTTAIQLDAHHFKSYYNRAFCYSKRSRYAEAVDDYTAALRIDGRNANAYHNRGVALEKLGQLKEAIDDFTRALECDPALTFSLNARGLVYDQLEEYGRALEDFTRAIQIDKRNPAWLHNRGYTYRNMGQLELAVADYTASIQLDPQSHTAYNNRAFAFRKLGRYEEAIEDYTVVLRVQPAQAVKALNNRAYCFARLDLFEDAIRDYTEVLATDHDNAHALYNRGISYEKCGKFNSAVDDFTRAIRLAPEAAATANAYYSRGTARLHLSHTTHAIADLQQALKLDSAASGLRGRALKTFQSKHPAYQLLRDINAI